MATFLVVSDTHGETRALARLLESLKGITGVFHLGDHAKDMAPFTHLPMAFHITNGNNDAPNPAYAERVVQVAGQRVFITHGDRWNVNFGLDRLAYRALELEATVCLYGHTHCPAHCYREGILFMNPGSLTAPLGESAAGYGLLHLSAEGATGQWKESPL